MNRALENLGRFVSRHRWWFVGVWVAVLVGLTVTNARVGGDFVNDYSVPGSESSAGRDVLSADFPSARGYSGQIVFHATSGAVSDHSQAVGTAMNNVGQLDHVVSATDPLKTSGTPAVSKNGKIAYGSVSWAVNPASLDDTYLDSLDEAVEPARSAGLTVEYGGGAGQIGHAADDWTSEGLGLAFALLLLLMMFGSVVAAFTPLVAAIFSVGAGLALVGLLAATTTIPTTAPTVATLLGLGVAVDYGLFLVARHREQLDHGMGVDESIGKTAGTSGVAIVIAGSTVVIAILGLYVASVPFLGALGAASAIVVAVTMLSALTLVPAFLAVSRDRVRPRSARTPATRPAHAHAHTTHEQSAFARWGRKVSDRPLPWAVGSVALLVLLAVPLFSMELGQVDAGSDPTSETDRRAYDLISEGFGPGANGPLSVVLELPRGTSQQQASSQLSSARTTIANTSGVASVSQPQVNSAGTVALLTAVPTTAPDKEATTDLVDHLRSSVLPGLDMRGSYVTGTTAGYVDFTERVADRMIWLILAVVLLSLVLLTVAFRSVVISLKAAALNLLSVGAAYGVVVAVFQWGWGSQLLGIDQNLPIPAYVPMLMFAIVFGLSMDYEVFLLSRVREAWEQTGDAHRAVAIGIGSTARVITTAAAVMVFVFSSFVLEADPTIKMVSVGMAVAVLIDASIVRMVLVPALMSLLGGRAWWLPHWLDRILPNLQLEGSVEPMVEPAAVRMPAQRSGAADEEEATPPNVPL